MESALSSGDVDALRLHLKQLASGSDTSMAGTIAPLAAHEEDHIDPMTRKMSQKAVSLADDLLRSGLMHLERETAAQTAAEAAAARTTIASLEMPLLRLPELNLSLRAQPVMGIAVWPAARALGEWLHARGSAMCAERRCIELGAGGGLPGLVARANGASFLLTTDGDAELLPLLRSNCEANMGGRWEAAALDWRQTDELRRHAQAAADDDNPLEDCGFDLVLAADVLYGASDVSPLCEAALVLLRQRPCSRLLLARSACFEALQHTFVARAEECGLSLVSATRAIDTRANANACGVMDVPSTDMCAERDCAPDRSARCYKHSDDSDAVVLEFALADRMTDGA